jgi:23S rRNA pseudouridine2605 synthase
MRLNKFIASNTYLSRRKADEAIADGRISINGEVAHLGAVIKEKDQVALDGSAITINTTSELYMLHKPAGYVCSRKGQGADTIYRLLPPELFRLNPIGRLDKDSTGLLLLTNNGDILNELGHPSHNHTKTYSVDLRQALSEPDEQKILRGIDIGDARLSKMHIKQLDESRKKWEVTLSEGRNRQIRRTFSAVHKQVIGLHRLAFATYSLGTLKPGEYKQLQIEKLVKKPTLL